MPLDLKELRDLTDAELVEKGDLLQQELFNFRFQLATGRIENAMKIRETRRDIARVKTIRRQLALKAVHSSEKVK